MNYYELETGQCVDDAGKAYHPEVSQKLEEAAFDCGFVEGGGLIDIDSLPTLFGARPKRTGRNSGPDAFEILGPWTIVSERLKEVLTSVAEGYVQFAPFEIRSHDGKDVQDGYFAIRVVHRIECVDRTRTTVWNDDWKPKINGTFKLNDPVVYSLSAMEGYPILTTQERFGFIVRDDVKEALEPFVGLNFHQLMTS
jgi:hypothetical protein